MMPISRAGTWTRRDGFTLIELAVVAVLLTLFAGLVLPRLATTGEDALRRAGRRLVKSVERLYGEAALTGRQHLLLVDLDRETVELRRLVPSGDDFVEETRDPARTLAGVRIKDVWVRQRGTFSEGTVRLRAYPVGWLEEAALYLENDRGEQLTVHISPLAGTARTSEGYVRF